MRFLLLWTSMLVVPLALLLFLQWPLRELIHAYSRQANDGGQILFALYVAVAVFAASRSGSHLAAGGLASDGGAAPTGWRAWAALACVGPWAVFMLWAAFDPIRHSVMGSERFAETLTPGFFMVKLALGLLLLLVLAQSVATVIGNRRCGA